MYGLLVYFEEEEEFDVRATCLLLSGVNFVENVRKIRAKFKSVRILIWREIQIWRKFKSVGILSPAYLPVRRCNGNM